VHCDEESVSWSFRNLLRDLLANYLLSVSAETMDLTRSALTIVLSTTLLLILVAVAIGTIQYVLTHYKAGIKPVVWR
jgi:hypothetical protein